MANQPRVERLGRYAGILALPVLAAGLYLGLLWAPPDAMMGDVQRIMYVHFPSWIAVALAYTTGFVASILYLVKRQARLDYWAQAGIEVGLVFNISGLITGSLWGRPTWGVYWTWDPRLTSTAIMAITFAGYLVLRSFIEDPDTRSRVAALVATVGFLNVPIVYFSVKWWRTLHQPQSNPSTVDPAMVLPLRIMMVAFTLLAYYLMTRRYLLAEAEGSIERESLRMEAANG
ncbi:MAG: cytochrome c biogenesis protein CcsA [Gemmatimonadetes bacterium]|nr:cytochrome c biogenesis protein CcsA [Gemmatimonadota bacterium]